jgi:hypothetical protein
MVIFLEGFSNYPGVIGDVLNQWSELGVFNFILPFLLIFSIIFAILKRVKVFDANNSIPAIISLASALLGARSPILGEFLSVLSGNVVVGLIIIFSILILLGLFLPAGDKSSGIEYTIMGIVIFIVILVFLNTSNSFSFLDGSWISGNLEGIISMIILVVVIIVIIGASTGKPSKPSSIFFSGLGEKAEKSSKEEKGK